ncbi:hypothetical protein [Kutzneria chonburiensis]|uniref:PE domain-containing protein n=1 Tax=Kutzneria chonburiensis TaxID=1483604 RepID=A0ABV6MWZ7_9PSEU|nr:hypothetical protein [Kutzneria chonburiensis]
MDMAKQVGADLGAIGAILNPLAGVADEYAAVSGGQITVNHDTVLQVGKIIHDQWQQLTDVTKPKLFHLNVNKIGDDKVSAAATTAWNAVLVTNDDSYYNRIFQYIDGLKALADNLRTAAQQYGYTEEQITDAFGAAG